jgi:hypothetical protein
MTEEEAKAKWCPHVRDVTLSSDGTLKIGSGFFVAGGCMSWRIEKPRMINMDLSLAENLKIQQEYAKHGYCGLAGNP